MTTDHVAHRRTARRVARWLALAGLLPALVQAGPPAAAPPIILGATVDPAAGTVTVRGRHFGEALPAVRLSGVTLEAISSDEGAVVARLARGSAPGRGVVEVVRADGASASRPVTLRPSVARAPRALGSPVLDGASASGVAVTIRGRNLGHRAPAVALDGRPLRLLTYDGHVVTARLGPGVGPGAHLVTVTTAAGATVSTKVTLSR